jgi:hypothetical protein
MTPPDAFEQYVLDQIEEAAEPFKPTVTYDPDGDCIEFLASDESFWAERIDSLVTVYYGQHSREIVGSLIKGVSKFIQEVLAKAPGFKIEVEDGRIKLEHFFTAGLWLTSDAKQEFRVLAYKKLREVAEKAHAEVPVPDLGRAA